MRKNSVFELPDCYFTRMSIYYVGMWKVISVISFSSPFCPCIDDWSQFSKKTILNILNFPSLEFDRQHYTCRLFAVYNDLSFKANSNYFENFSSTRDYYYSLIRCSLLDSIRNYLELFFRTTFIALIFYTDSNFSPYKEEIPFVTGQNGIRLSIQNDPRNF